MPGPEPDRRARPRALVASLALVIAAALLASIAAGVRFVTRGDSARPVARVMTSDTGIPQDSPRPVFHVIAAPAVHQPRPAPRQTPKPPQPARHSREPKKPPHPRRHSRSPKSQLSAGPQQPQHHGKRAHVHRGPQVLDFMLLDHAVLDMHAAGASQTLGALQAPPMDPTHFNEWAYDPSGPPIAMGGLCVRKMLTKGGVKRSSRPR